MPFRRAVQETNVFETLKTMGTISLQLLFLLSVKAFVYVVLVKFYKFLKRIFWKEEVNEDEDKHDFDYESDWEDQVEGFHGVGEADEVLPESGDGDAEFMPDEEVKTKTEELVNSLRERKSYKGMTIADFEKLCSASQMKSKDKMDNASKIDEHAKKDA